MIDIKDALTLSDKHEYVVVSKAKYNDNIYLYLIDINNHLNFKFCLLNNNKVIEVKDDELLSKLLPLFYVASKNIINEFKS